MHTNKDHDRRISEHIRRFGTQRSFASLELEMEGGGKGLADKGWVEVQKKTFTNWTNDKLKETDRQVEDLQSDLQDGVALVTLLQVLAPGKKIGR